MAKDPKRPSRPNAQSPRRSGQELIDTFVPVAAAPSEAARYIAEFTAELSAIARQSRLDLLAYLLDMAHLEATRAEDDPRIL
jgi:hypothetical protein